MKKIIFFELNEVPKKIFIEYVNKYPNSYLKYFLNNTNYYDTKAVDKGHLSPWITWPTVHRGVSNIEHKIHDYGQNLSYQNNRFPPIWEYLKKKKFSVGVFGSLHSNFLPKDYKDYSFYVPDVFAPHNSCSPERVKNFHNFQLNMTKNSSRNVKRNLDLKDTILFLKDSLKNGITLSTFSIILKQLINEFFDVKKSVRRRTIHSLLAFDVFFSLLDEKKPDFSTIFTNHVASSMHRYWEASFPNEFSKLNQSKKWYEDYKNEIFYSMKVTEIILRKLCKFVNKNQNFNLWVLSSMGQSPNKSFKVNNQLLLDNPEIFFSNFFIKKSEFRIKPSMAPIYVFEICNPNKIKNLEQLKNIKIEGEKIKFQIDGKTLFIEIGQTNIKTEELIFNNNSCALSKFGFKKEDIQDFSGSSAYHHPNGTFFIYPKEKNRNFNKFLEGNYIPTDKLFSILKESFDKYVS